MCGVWMVCGVGVHPRVALGTRKMVLNAHMSFHHNTQQHLVLLARLSGGQLEGRARQELRGAQGKIDRQTDRQTDGRTFSYHIYITQPTNPTPDRSISQVARVCRETEGQRAEVEPDFEVAYLKGLAGKSIMQWPPRAIPDTWPAFFQVWRGRRLMGGEAGMGWMNYANPAVSSDHSTPIPIQPNERRAASSWTTRGTRWECTTWW